MGEGGGLWPLSSLSLVIFLSSALLSLSPPAAPPFHPASSCSWWQLGVLWWFPLVVPSPSLLSPAPRRCPLSLVGLVIQHPRSTLRAGAHSGGRGASSASQIKKKKEKKDPPTCSGGWGALSPHGSLLAVPLLLLLSPRVPPLSPRPCHPRCGCGCHLHLSCVPCHPIEAPTTPTRADARCGRVGAGLSRCGRCGPSPSSLLSSPLPLDRKSVV